MFRQFMKNKKAQNTAEYALLIALVVAGVIAMQTYAQRALQARMRDAAQYMVTNAAIGSFSTNQYEPYYLASDYTISRNSEDKKILGNGITAMSSNTQRVRDANGFQASTYNGIVE